MSETLGHFFTGPVAVGGAGSQAVITFQSGTRQHYALRSGHFGWVGPELMMSGVDTNPSIEPAPVSASDRLVAYRADDELSRSPAVIALTPEGDPLIVWGSNIGNGARVNATTCR